MTAITPLWDEMPLQPLSAVTKAVSFGKAPAAAADDPFTDIFRSAINAVKETDKEKTNMEYLMATGQLDNPVPMILAANKAELSVSLLMQLRSKAMDAYNELMRISL